MEKTLGKDLLNALNELNGSIESFEEITRLRSTKSERACFRLQFQDGRIFKGRRFRSARRRESVTRLMPLLKDLPFSRVLAADGIATVEEWIVGNTLHPGVINSDQTRNLAAVLGTLHSIRYCPETQAGGVPDAKWYLDRAKNHLQRLLRAGSLEPDITYDLIGLAKHYQPANLENGLTHGDFHPHNMVVNRVGEIWIVDNEHIKFSALDYDIARCWRHWPMTQSQREVFCSTYGNFRSLDTFMAHQQFWTICTLAVTAIIHSRYGRSNDRFIEELCRISQNTGELL